MDAVGGVKGRWWAGAGRLLPCALDFVQCAQPRLARQAALEWGESAPF